MLYFFFSQKRGHCTCSSPNCWSVADDRLQARVDPVLVQGPTSGIVNQVDAPSHGLSAAVDKPHHSFRGHPQRLLGAQVAVPALGEQPADPTATYMRLEDWPAVEGTQHLSSADPVRDTSIDPWTDFEDLPDRCDPLPEEDFLSILNYAWEMNSTFEPGFNY